MKLKDIIASETLSPEIRYIAKATNDLQNSINDLISRYNDIRKLLEITANSMEVLKLTFDAMQQLSTTVDEAEKLKIQDEATIKIEQLLKDSNEKAAVFKS